MVIKIELSRYTYVKQIQFAIYKIFFKKFKSSGPVARNQSNLLQH